MDNEELTKWAYDELDNLRQKVLDIHRMQRLIENEKERLYNYSSGNFGDIRVQTSKNPYAMEDRIIRLVDLRDALIDAVKDYLPVDRDICSKLNKLPCNQSCVLAYRYCLGWSYDKIASQMHISSMTVRRWKNIGLFWYGCMFYPVEAERPDMSEIQRLMGAYDDAEI